jgi:hypothetical protein
MHNNYHYQEHLVKERIDARLQEAENYRTAKAGRSKPNRRYAFLDDVRRVFVNAIAFVSRYVGRLTIYEKADHHTPRVIER